LFKQFKVKQTFIKNNLKKKQRKKKEEKKKKMEWETFQLNFSSICFCIIIFLLVLLLSLEQPAHSKYSKLYQDIKALQTETSTTFLHCLKLESLFKSNESTIVFAYQELKSKLDQWKVYERLYALEEIGEILGIKDFVSVHQKRHEILNEMYKMLAQKRPNLFILKSTI
jgi:Mn2+/Fe2+ NRAMP family transporter